MATSTLPNSALPLPRRFRRRVRAAVVAALCLALAGCGSTITSEGAAPTRTVTVPATSPPPDTGTGDAGAGDTTAPTPGDTGDPHAGDTTAPTPSDTGGTDPGSVESGSVTEEPEPAVVDPTVPAQDLADGSQDNFCSGGSHENCHSYGDMLTYLNHMIALIEPMFVELYGAAARPANHWYVPGDVTGTMACVDREGRPGTYDGRSYLYCPADQSIYVGQDQLWRFYFNIGDAAPAVGYAHEWGHHIQRIRKVPHSPEVSVQYENQADCIAGAWVGYAERHGWLEYPDDVDDIAGILEAIAASEFDLPREHGTLTERRDSLVHGYLQGIAGCNDFFPQTPVY